MCFIWSSGRLRNRVSDDHQVGRLSRASRPGMLSCWLGLIVPSLVDGEKHGALEAVALGQDLGQLGRASSERYSSSPLTRTTCLPLPGPLLALEDDPGVFGRGAAGAVRQGGGGRARPSARCGDYSKTWPRHLVPVGLGCGSSRPAS